MKKTRKHIHFIGQRTVAAALTITFISSIISPQNVLAQPQSAPAPTAVIALKGIILYPEDPLKFDLLIDRGGRALEGALFEKETAKVAKYFLASLAVAKDDMWVNLSPYEKGRMIPDVFGKTEMGRDMLMQDYVLKEFTASILNPGSKQGKEFWDRVYALATEKFGTVDIPVSTYNKVWIQPDTADVYEHGSGAYILRSHLKVMLESDYLAMSNDVLLTRGHGAPSSNDKRGSVSPSRLPSEVALDAKATEGINPLPIQELTKDILREIILPEIEKEVNEGAAFGSLRQMFNAIILAAWYKQALQESLLGQEYADKNKVGGVSMRDRSANERIYQQYTRLFSEGVFDYIKEEFDPVSGTTIPRKYVAGGIMTGDLKMNIVRSLSLSDMSQGVDMERVTIGLSDGSARDQVRMTRQQRIAAARRVREVNLDRIRAESRILPAVDFSKAGLMQPYLETLFVPWSPGKRQMERAAIDYWRTALGIGLMASESMDISARFFGNPFVFGMGMWKNVRDRARRVKKSLDYLKSLDGQTPAHYSDEEIVLRVPGLFYLTKIKTAEGQSIDPDLPPALLITPHSGHDGRSLADYTNKDGTDGNSLAQTFKKRGYETYLLVWESSQELLDIGDLQEAVHLSVRTIGRKVVIGGLCHGGAVGSHYYAAMPDDVAGLIAAGAPEDTHVGDNDVTRAVKLGMDVFRWLQFGEGPVKEVYPGEAQLYAFKHLGYNGGYDKREPQFLELVENVDDIDFIERHKIFWTWFGYVKNIGYLVDWVYSVFEQGFFMQGKLEFRLGDRWFKADPKNYKKDVPVASIEGYTDDITPPPTITVEELGAITSDVPALWDFLTKGVVSRQSLAAMPVNGQDAFDHLVAHGYLDNARTGNADYGFVVQDRLTEVTEKLEAKRTAFLFTAKDFQDQDDTPDTVLPKIQALITTIDARGAQEGYQAKHYTRAINWLNMDTTVFKLLSRDELLKIDGELVQEIERFFGGPIDRLDAGQLKKMTVMFQGIKLKRLITSRLFPDLTPEAKREKDADYEANIDKGILTLLHQQWNARFFSDSDPKSVNSTPGKKAVMRASFQDIAFNDDFEAFKGIDAPFIRNTDVRVLRVIFDHLRMVRGQSSALLSAIPTRHEYQFFKLVSGGHIGIYNGSNSQKEWAGILAEFERIWKSQGLDADSWDLGPTDVVLAWEDKVLRGDEARQSFYDAAALNEGPASRDLGGIDLNADHLKMIRHKAVDGLVIPQFRQPIGPIDFDQLAPVVLDIRPVVHYSPGG